MGYYDVHCVKCGKKYESSIMAFDFDAILKKSLDIGQSQGGLGSGSELDCFREVKLGLYFTYYKLMNTFHVTDKESRVLLKAGDILEFINEKYEVSIEEFYQKDSNSNQGFQTPQFAAFCDQLKLYQSNVDIDKREKMERVKSICKYLVNQKDSGKEILDCRIHVRLAKNDMGEEFASSMDVTYFDGSRDYIDYMVCLYCGSPFFPKAGLYQEYVVGMVGSARVGKTAYLAALLNELNPQMGKPPFPNIAVCAENDRRWREFIDNVMLPFRQGKKINKTEEIDAMVSLFTVHIIINSKNYLFTFVDMPGEAFVPPATQSGERNYHFVVEKRPILQHTDIFWFCVDPVQIDGELMEENGLESSDDWVDTDMDRVIGNIKPVLRFLKEQQRLTAAVILTKSDKISNRYELFEPRKGQQLPMVEGETFRWDRFVNFSKRVRDYFDGDTVKNLENDISQMFDQYNYFAVAAYGRKISKETKTEYEGGEGKGNLPSHILDPFLWSLAALKLLSPGQHGEVVVSPGFFGIGRVMTEGIVPVDYSELFCNRKGE